MKTKYILTSALAASCMSCLAVADDPKKGAEELINPPAQPYSERAPRINRFEHLGHPEKASGVIGMRVENYQHEKLGKVDDLAVDLESGRIAQVIVSTGGFLGIGDKDVAVPPSALHCDFANKVIHLDADKEKLKAAPKFEMSKWRECCEPTRVLEVYRYYGQDPYFTASVDGINQPTGRIESRDANGVLIVHAREGKNYTGGMGYVEKGTKLMGMPVKNLQDERLGKVDNLIVDLASSRLVAVVLSSGGFLGMGDELSIVPPAALRYNADHDGVILDATKDSLTQAPHFKSTEWPNLSEPVYVERVYRVYQIEPYFSTEPDADNSKINARDRHGETVTPFDQSGNAADRQTTARIRQEIVAQKDFSVSAKNVKVITSADGRVTLRGTVKSADERRRIEEIANRVATGEKVDNQLDVKGDSSN